MNVIEVRIPSTFVAERSYAVSVLLGEFLGLRHVIVPVEGLEDYLLISSEGRRITVRDRFFGGFAESTGYLRRDAIPDRAVFLHNPFAPEEDIPVIFGDGELEMAENGIVCGIDIFSSAFFMLTRWEEYADPSRDRHDRFPASASLAFRGGFLHRPVVNEYVEMLWNMLRHLGCGQRRKERSPAFVATHDVDFPLRWNLRSFIKTCAGDLVKRKDLLLAFRNARSFLLTKAGAERDPYDTFDWLMAVSEGIGIRARFFFMAGGDTVYDTRYPVESGVVRSLLAAVHERGHEIGFHPSYDACCDEVLWGRELEQLSRLSPQGISGGREHYLRFAAPETWQIWENHGMEYDSTLGYADHEGFRCGSCYSYPVFNFLTRERLRLREMPLTAMDLTLAIYRGLGPEESFRVLCDLWERVRKYRGEFVLLWHNSSLGTGLWEPFRKVYVDFLRHAVKSLESGRNHHA